jgi:hypothetical protein
MAKVNQEDLYIWGTSGTGVPGGVISSGSYVMTHDGTSWSTSGIGINKPTPVKEKIYTVTGRLKKIKWKQS